jgi:host factor-I protein
MIDLTDPQGLAKTSIASLETSTNLWRQKEPPMEKLAQNIQEAFLNNARKDKTFLTIYLMSGVKLSGRIKSFDKYSVILETNNQEQLIFKHAISTVVVSKPFHTGPHTPSAAVAAASPGSHGAPGTPVPDTAEQ